MNRLGNWQWKPRRLVSGFPLFLFFFFLLLVSPAFAQEDLIINADSISYEKDNIVAEGSVEAIYKDNKALGNRLVYNTTDRSIKLNDGFIFFYGDIVISGDEIEYELDNDKGRGKKVRVNYESVFLEGNYLDFNKEEIKLKGASFDTCGIKPDPHYRISAQQMSLYPATNWLVSYWGIFWYGKIPTLPIPVYVYDLEAERKGTHNILPYPEVGSNDDDGLYISERVVWYARRELSGSFNINYSEKKGLGSGFEANYILSKENQGNFRLYGNYHEPFWGGLTHHYYFGPSVGNSFLPTDLFSAATYKQLDLETNLSLRERINYERVTKSPEIYLNIKDPKIKIGVGIISENSKEAVAKGHLSYLWESKIYDRNDFEIIPSILLDYSKYSKGRYWWRNIGKLTFNKKWSPIVSNSLAYSRFFDQQGASPFLYENYKLITSDQFSANMQFNFFKSTLMVEAVYDIPSWNPYDIDYTIEAGVHCHAFGFRYRAIRNEFGLIFRII